MSIDNVKINQNKDIIVETNSEHPASNMPFGYSLAFDRKEEAKNGYADLTETEKEHLILKCKDARSDKEIAKITSAFTPEINEQLLEEESTVYGPLENNKAF